MKGEQTRRQIIEVADALFYERGFEATSFADIAGTLGLSRGNFYYHYKTKDEILQAVIAYRIEKTRVLLSAWEARSDDPQARILSFFQILIANKTKIMAHGCPVGTLCNELAKLEHPAKAEAVELFALFRDWLAGAFAALGRQRDAPALAMHVLMRSQGVASLATAFCDEAFIDREVNDFAGWLAHTLAEARPATEQP